MGNRGIQIESINSETVWNKILIICFRGKVSLSSIIFIRLKEKNLSIKLFGQDNQLINLFLFDCLRGSLIKKKSSTLQVCFFKRSLLI